MIIIDKAILHILDASQGLTTLSDEVLDADAVIDEFLARHIERSMASQDAKQGHFYETSDCKVLVADYLAAKIGFVDFSQRLARLFSQALASAEEASPSDFIVGDVRIDDQRRIALLKSSSHMGFAHIVSQTDSGIRNDISGHIAIMPGLNQKMEEFALIDTETLAISSYAKKYTIDGNSIYILPEMVLECGQTPSPKETIKKISKTAAAVAEAYGQNDISTAAAVKSYLCDNLQSAAELDPYAAGREIFQGNPAMQAEYEKTMQEAGFTEPIAVNPEAAMKKLRSHKLKTDTGIELSIPIDYFDNTEFVEFKHNADGSLSIMLKNIQNIINR